MDWQKRSKRQQMALLANMKALAEEGEPVHVPVVKKKKKRNMVERKHLCALVRWLRLNAIPVVKVTNEGGRSAYEGAVFKAEGLWAGACDVVIPRASGKYHSFWLEMKAPGEKPRPNQLEFMEAMRKEGNYANWYDDWEKAKIAVEKYLGLPSIEN